MIRNFPCWVFTHPQGQALRLLAVDKFPLELTVILNCGLHTVRGFRLLNTVYVLSDSNLQVISLPIGHHVQLQESLKSFTDGLLNCKPVLPGVDRDIVIAPRRLHLTLGVMTLENSSGRTLADAQALLWGLRPRIMELLDGHGLCIPLTEMNIMNPDRGNADNAHVLWLGPSMDTEDARRLKSVSEFVNKAFSDAGFIQDRRPLKLHCTILNTSYRKPYRQPFSYNAILTSSFIREFVCTPHDFRDPVKVELGTWNVDEIQICKMGSYGPEGEYVSCGCCSLAS